MISVFRKIKNTSIYIPFRLIMTSSVDTIVSVEWLKNNLNNPKGNICLLDASWHLPSFGRNAIQEFKDGHIAGAQFFNIAPYNCGLPTAEVFAKDVAPFRVTSQTHVVLYDSNPTFGLFSAPRAWWLWRSYGHSKVSILDGGIPAWKEANGQLTTDAAGSERGNNGDPFQAKFTACSCTKTRAEIEENVVSKNSVLIDTRSAGRFAGIDPEPRPDIKSGHILNSINIPFPCCLTADKRMKTAEQLRNMFKEKSVDFSKPTIASCGSGVSACFMVLAGHLIGQEVSLYDGAWIDFFQNGAADLKMVAKD